MLGVSFSKVAQVILLGRQIDRAEGELRGFLETLNEDERNSLIAIMSVGRDSFTEGKLPVAFSAARRHSGTSMADFIIGTPNFADHLEVGLEALGLSAPADEEELL